MAQQYLRSAFNAARPLRACNEPLAFFQTTRSPTTRTREIFFKTTLYNLRPRAFSVSTADQATVVLQNPRVDDDGQDMIIEISERAANRLKQITSTPPQRNTLVAAPKSTDSHLRVTVTSGGCHGFQYLMSLEPADKIDGEEDTIFSATTNGENDDDGRAQVVMDLPSLELLKGSTVDYTTELIGSQFKIVGNPRATSSCGCGTSFDIE